MRLFLISNMYPSKSDRLYGVFVKNKLEEFERQGVIFTNLALIKGRPTTWIKKLLAYIRHFSNVFFRFFKRDYDLIYLHYFSHHIPVLLLLLPFKKRPWVVNVHGDDVTDLIKNPKLNFFGKIVLKRVDLLVVPSEYFKVLVKTHYPFIKNKVVFVSPSGGVNLKTFFPHQVFAENNSLKLGFVSRFVKEKGWKIFLEALVLLKQYNINCKGIIVGKGPDEMKLRSFIENHDLGKDIDFVGTVTQNKLAQLFNKMDLYVFPTYRKAESLGLTGLEAMACGTPVIASDIAGPKTYINSGRNGFLFSPKSVEELVDKVEAYHALSSQEKLALRENAVKVAQSYERSVIARKLIRELEKLG